MLQIRPLDADKNHFKIPGIRIRLIVGRACKAGPLSGFARRGAADSPNFPGFPCSQEQLSSNFAPVLKKQRTITKIDFLRRRILFNQKAVISV